MANPKGEWSCGSSLTEERRKLKGKEKVDETMTSFFPSSWVAIIRAEMEAIRGGSCSSETYPITAAAAEARNYNISHNNDNGNGNNDGKNKRKQREGERSRSGRCSSSKKVRGPEPEPCPHGWEEAVRMMGGGTIEPTWFCTKALTHADLDPQQNRLLLPRLQVKKLVEELLTERERRELERKGGGGIKAVMVDEMGRCWKMGLNYWASKSYNLNGSWRWVVEKYHLSEENAVKVGAFRYSSDEGGDGEEYCLGFVLHIQLKRRTSPAN